MMMGKAFLKTKTRIQAERLRRDMTGVFGAAPRVRSGAVVGVGQVRIGEQRYTVGELPASAQAGSSLRLRNVGRLASAVYVPDTAGAAVTGASSTSGSGVVSGMAGLQDDNSLRVLPDGSGYIRLHGDAGGILSAVSDAAYSVRLGINLNAIDHNSLANLTSGDPHTQYPLLSGTETISGLWTFSRSTNPPFAVNSGAGKVANLDADKLDGLDSTAFLSPQYLTLATNSNLSNERVLVAGDGLTLTDGGAGGNATLAVGISGLGLGLGADAVTLTSSSNPGAAASILATDASGYLTLVRLKTDTLADRSGGNLTVSPAGDLLLSPTGADVRVQSGVTLRSENYASQTTGWGIDYAGGADFRYLFADEMHVKAFIADLEQALAGGQIISKSVAMVATMFTAPAAGGTATLTVRDLPSASGMAAFQSGDIVRLRTFSRASGALSVSDCWGVVTSYVNNGNGTQSWTFTRSTAPNAGGMTAGTQVQPDSIVLDYGTSGNGFYEVNAIDGAYGVNSPYAQVATWTTHPATGTSVRTRLGNVKGITSQAEYGIWAGQNTTDKYLRLTDTNFEAHGLRVSLYNSGTERIRLDSAVPSIGLGATLPTGFGQAGIWMGRHSDGTYRLSVEESNGDQYLRWTHDGSRYYLDISGDIYLHDSPGAGGDDLGPTLAIDNYGKIDMGANSYIEMGANSTFAADSGSTFSIGNPSSGDYLSFANGVLTLKGKIIVTDGADLDARKYTPYDTSLWINDGSYTSTHFRFTPPYYVGFVVMEDGNRYYLVDNTDGPDMNVLRANSRHIIFFCHKDGTGITNSNVSPARDYWGVDNWGTFTYLGTPYTSPAIDAIAENEDVYYSSYTAEERKNHIRLGHAYLNSDLSDIEYISGAGVSGSTVIGAGFIRTDSLAAISANMGNVTAGSIVVGSSNKLWLNDDTTAPTVALAIGGSTKASAPFLVYETGAFHAGGASTNYIDWNGSTLIVKADIRADAGYLGSLTVDGNLTMNGGRLRWNSNNSYIDNSKIVISDVRSTVLVGDTSQLTLGLINIDLVDSGQGSWRYGVRVADGGNSLANVSSLYHGESAVAGAAAVDRIYNAQTSNGSYADGFYGEMHSYSGSDFNTSGVPFKGKHLTGGSVAVLNQSVDAGDVGTAPAVWIGSSAPNRSIVKVQTGATGQVGFHLDNPNAYSNFLALVTGNGDVSHGSGRGRFTVKGSTDTVGTPPSGEAYVYVKMLYVSRDNINEYRPCLCIKRDNGTEYYMVPYTNF